MSLKSEKGQALVELAIAISLLLMILLGIVEFARIGHAYLVATHASREGARVGALRHADPQIVNHVWDSASSLNLDRLVVSIRPSQASRLRGESVEVTVTYDVALITPLGRFLPDPFPVVGRTVMRVE